MYLSRADYHSRAGPTRQAPIPDFAASPDTVPKYGLIGASTGFTISTGCAFGILGFSTLFYVKNEKISA